MVRICALSLVGVVSGVINIGWTDCGSTKAHAKVKSVTVSLASPMPGDNITVVASVDIDRATTGISSDFVLAKVIHNKFDGCALSEFKLRTTSTDESSLLASPLFFI